MYFTCLLLLTILKICASLVLFRIHSNNKNTVINSSYLLGTVHVEQNLIWPYLSNNVLRILIESEEIWTEHDLTDLQVRKYLYRCEIYKMTPKERALLRAKTWSQFLNETKRNPNDQSIKSNNRIKWRNWLINKYGIPETYFWRNRTISDDTIFDHRIILEAYQRGIYVGSLESIPNKCFPITNSSKFDKSKSDRILSRFYNCDMMDEHFLNEMVDLSQWKKRNQEITKQIRKLLKKDPHKKYLFAVGAGHLFGNVSIVQMLKNQFNNDYRIEQINLPSSNFPYEHCTDEESARLINEFKTMENKSTTKRFIQDELFDRI